MRVLFTVSSWATHYAAMVPLGWALQASGHEVRILCPPSQVDPICRAGFIPVPILGGMDVATSNRLQYYWEAMAGIWPYPWLPLHPITGAQMSSLRDFDVSEYRRSIEPRFVAQSRQSFDNAVDFARAWRPDLVLHDPANLDGLLAAKVTAVPSALCLWGPIGSREAEHMRVVPLDISDSFSRHGLGKFTLDLIEHVIDPSPPALAPPIHGSRIETRFVPYNGCAPAPEWLLEPAWRPRICVAWSTALSLMSGPSSYALPTFIEALSGLDYEVIVTATSRDAAALNWIPESVRLLEHMPLRLLLPSCSAIIHHGGSGNTMTALWAGVPQLAVTFASEQATAAGRVSAAGAGIHLPGDRATATAVREAVAQLLSGLSYRDSAAQLCAQIAAQPTLTERVSTLEELAGSKGATHV